VIFLAGFDTPFSRRHFTLGAVAMGAAAGFALPAGATPVVNGKWQPNFDDPNDNVEAYMKMTSTLGDEIVRGWFGGHVFSLVENQPLRPLMKLEGFGVGNAKRQPDGSYRIGWKEVGFYKDLVTDQVIDSWINPLGDRTQVMHIQNHSVASTISPTFKKQSGGPPGMDQSTIQRADYRRPNDASEPFLLPWWQIGDTTILWMDVSAVLPNPLPPEVWPRESSGQTIRIAEQTMYSAKTADFTNPALQSVDYVGAWNRFSPWLPWMEMGGQPGGLFLRAGTKRMRSFDELSPTLRAYAEKHYPEFLDPTVDPNLKNESSWEVFKRTRKPLLPR
jgi:hypothetical protein